LKNAHCFSHNAYVLMNQAAANLKDGDCGPTDHSSPGDWRRPTKEKWSATIAMAVTLNCIA
jgi:hypothetical protein